MWVAIDGAQVLESVVADFASVQVLLIFVQKIQELLHAHALRTYSFVVIDELLEDPFGRIWVKFCPEAFEKTKAWLLVTEILEVQSAVLLSHMKIRLESSFRDLMQNPIGTPL